MTKLKKKAAAKKSSLAVETFKVRQIAVNVISGNLGLITCPQSPNMTWTPVATFTDPQCPWSPLGCATPSRAMGVIRGDIGAKQLTELLTKLKAPAPFTQMSVHIAVSAAKRKATVDAIKKAQKAK